MFGGKTLGKILDSLRQYLQIDLAQNMRNNIILVYSTVREAHFRQLTCQFFKQA
jgi:hypothetical protein